ncbi:hypothetical protein [Ideonella sp.]|uniref:hypothetical protein n=1 Tax=Ideonella sp. TaxID=1929293 RepID=UPI0035B49718
MSTDTPAPSATQTPPPRRSPWVLILLIALLVLAGVAVVKLNGFGWHASDSAAIEKLRVDAQSMAEPRQGAAKLAVTMFDEYRDVARLWSGVYNGCVLGASALGLLAALVLKLEAWPQRASLKKDLAAAMASLSAILAALSSSGDFQMKWQTNRTAVADVERIAIRLLSPSPLDLASVYAELGDIAQERHLKLIGVKRTAGDDAAAAKAAQAGSAAPAAAKPDAASASASAASSAPAAGKPRKP